MPTLPPAPPPPASQAMDLENLTRDYEAQLAAVKRQYHAREDKLLLEAKAEKDVLREGLSVEVRGWCCWKYMLVAAG
jgi:hypothetical protein